MQYNVRPASVFDADVQTLIKRHGWGGAITSPRYEALGYSPSNCHLSAKHRAKSAGGRRIHGWALWHFDVAGAGSYVHAEHHSIWRNLENVLIDVTPPKFGSGPIFFIEDDTAIIKEEAGQFVMWSERTSLPGAEYIHLDQVFGPNWHLSPTEPNMVAYCKTLNIQPSDILTDDKYG